MQFEDLERKRKGYTPILESKIADPNAIAPRKRQSTPDVRRCLHRIPSEGKSFLSPKRIVIYTIYLHSAGESKDSSAESYLVAN